MLDCYKFQAQVTAVSYNGPQEIPVNFCLVLNPEADEWRVQQALRALTSFYVEDATMDVDVSLN